MLKRLRFGLLAGLLFLGTSQAVSGQDMVAWQAIRNNQQSQTYFRTALLTNNALRRRRQKAASPVSRQSSRKQGRQTTRGTSSTRTATNPSGTAVGSTTFQPVAPMLVPQQLASQAAQNQSDRREMEAFFIKCLQNYESNMKQQGQPVKDVARAVSYFIGVNYNVYAGGDALDAQQGAALRTEIKEALAEDDGFQRLSNREKQQMYETMAVMAEYVAISADVAAQKGNKQLADMARELAKENLEKLLGVSASQIKITSQGLEF